MDSRKYRSRISAKPAASVWPLRAGRLYEIPITSLSSSSRKPMARVPFHPCTKAGERPRFEGASRYSRESVALSGRRQGAFKCLMPSCWPWDLASSCCRWATPTPATVCKERHHDFRLHARRPRLRGAADLPDLRPAAARTFLAAYFPKPKSGSGKQIARGYESTRQ